MILYPNKLKNGHLNGVHSSACLGISMRNAKICRLKDRAKMLQKVRSFFSERNILEVDCPALSLAAPIDAHIDVMQVDLLSNIKGYLHTSAEYGLKRLISMGMGDIYQMSHVFRRGEVGKLHNPEFTMIEWYRLGWDLSLLIEETLALIRLFLPIDPIVPIYTYRELFISHLKCDYVYASTQELLHLIQQHSIPVHGTPEQWDKDTLLSLLMSHYIEPKLGKKGSIVVCDYPATQAMLAQQEQKGDELVAKRFEVYVQGIELANGFLELTDAQEQRIRLQNENIKRQALGKPMLPIDERFLYALESGVPPCSGVAVGFDRLMMLRHDQCSLQEILPFAWKDI